ncbi:recombinase family protein [Rhodococcus erythropolis]|uniref:recombinase family protein n=1 Tax=Rhodococcus erythropolis TaxID=1833 RepID=UPI001FD3842E|nr:recombinase family protein [Rhodococcus erythropolis]
MRGSRLPIRPLDAQSDALSAAGCFKVWTETASGATTTRPQLTDLLVASSRTDIPWSSGASTCWGVHLPHLLQTVENLPGPRSRLQIVDRSDRHHPPSGGKLIFSIFGALPEFERNLIRERTQVGLAAARARGRTGCRPPKMTSTKLAQAQRMRENGLQLTDIAEIIGVGRTTLYRHLK